MANNAVFRRVSMDIPMSSRKHSRKYRSNDDTFSDADTADLIGEADAVLSNTPCKPMDLSAYLVPEDERQPLHSAAKTTPASLETQDDVPLDEDIHEISDLLEYLKELGFDSPRSLLESHSHRTTPNHPSATPMPLNRDTRNTRVQTPANRKILSDNNNQTWPAGQKSIFRSSAKQETPRKQAATTVDGTTDKQETSRTHQEPIIISQAHVEVNEVPGKPYNDENDDDHGQGEWDVSLEELLEETANAMLSPRKTWQFSEEEWERLEKVQQMAEFLLREAEHERESARRWARSVHESVLVWVEEQRALNEVHADSLANDKVQLKMTREALHRLKLEMETATTHHGTVREKLNAVIQRQADTIKVLEAKLQDKAAAEATAPAVNTPLRSVPRARTPISSTRVPRVSLSPTAGRPLDKQMVADASSPISNIDPITPTKHDALPDSVPSPMSMTVTPRIQRARTSLVDGGKLIMYRNGTEKETRPDGTCIIRFPNGDVKCTLGSETTAGIVAYYHAKEQVCMCCCR